MFGAKHECGDLELVCISFPSHILQRHVFTALASHS